MLLDMVIKSPFVTIIKKLARCCLDVNLPTYFVWATHEHLNTSRVHINILKCRSSVGSIIKRMRKRHDHLEIIELPRETNCNSGTNDDFTHVNERKLRLDCHVFTVEEGSKLRSLSKGKKFNQTVFNQKFALNRLCKWGGFIYIIILLSLFSARRGDEIKSIIL